MLPTKANRGSFAAKTCVTGHERVWGGGGGGTAAIWLPKVWADGFSRLAWPREGSGSCVRLHLAPPPSLSQNGGTAPLPDTDY